MKDVRHNHSAILKLHTRSSLAEVDAACRKAKILYGDWQYVKDDEFELALKSITSLKKARLFIKELNKDRNSNREYPCQKAAQIRQWLKCKFFRGKYIKTAISAARRTMCGCHETGSFELRKFS